VDAYVQFCLQLDIRNAESRFQNRESCLVSQQDVDMSVTVITPESCIHLQSLD
jgi:hypothetical protein